MKYSNPLGKWLWGVATSAHQSEGDNVRNDWYHFEMLPKKIKRGERSGKATDFWNRFEEDIKLAKEFGMNTFRFSLEWSRIVPKPGTVDGSALAHYQEIIDTIRKYELEPMVTLHHFTLPKWIANKGGWVNKRNLKHWRFYVATVARNIENVILWNTINEPNVVIAMGYFTGVFPPGNSFDIPGYVKAIRNILLAHGFAYHIVKKYQPESEIGIVKNITWFYPYRRWSFSENLLAWFFDYMFNEITLRALRTGKLPLSLQPIEFLKNSIDFFGLNYYTKSYVRIVEPGSIVMSKPHEFTTQMGQVPYPEGLTLAIKRVSNLGKPVIITENGVPTLDESVRKAYLEAHLRAVEKAIQEEIDIRGYIYWSITDNFEWAEGFEPRFGLVEIDYETLERKPRKTAYWFRERIKSFKYKGYIS